MRQKLVVLRGLPASGKSTYAAQLVIQNNYKRFNRDDMRMMIDNSIFSADNEALITDFMYFMIDTWLEKGYNVVLDNTHLNPYTVKEARRLAADHDAEIEIRDFDVPVQVCIDRDLQRDAGRVGKSVILHMYKKWFRNGKMPEV